MEPTPETSPPPKVADGEKAHTLHLCNGATTLMRVMLAGQGWAKKPHHVRRGKKLRALIPKVEAPKDEESVEEWAGAGDHVIEVPESLRKVGADCIAHFNGQGFLGATDGAACLLTEFGVVEE